MNVPPEKAWRLWNEPEHIVHWCHAGDGWTTPFAENDLRVGGILKTAFGSPDGKNDFVLTATYTHVDEPRHIRYKMSDGRPVSITFEATPEGTHITETFGAEDENSLELQRQGWFQIMKNFKEYAEKQN